ncbi:MAG: hypothetical protein ACJ754_14945 [Pyrinomonadaceae bacterium]
MGMKIVTPRELLLVEVERWCGDHACNARTRFSLTKAEARAYKGFECSRCERWNVDALTERDVPEWWEELQVASLKEVEESEGLGDEEGEGGESF